MRDPLERRRSSRLYLRLDPADLAFFKFVLEAYDNLACMSVVDKYSAVARLAFAPEREAELREYLACLRDEICFSLLELPLSDQGHPEIQA